MKVGLSSIFDLRGIDVTQVASPTHTHAAAYSSLKSTGRGPVRNGASTEIPMVHVHVLQVSGHSREDIENAKRNPAPDWGWVGKKCPDRLPGLGPEGDTASLGGVDRA